MARACVCVKSTLLALGSWYLAKPKAERDGLTSMLRRRTAEGGCATQVLLASAAKGRWISRIRNRE